MIRLCGIVLLLLLVAFIPLSRQQDELRVGSKKFTESVLLGEMVRLLMEDAGADVTHYRELGGTQLVFEALRNGEIDIYPEYTGTIQEEILASPADSRESLRSRLRERGVVMSEPLGFNNTYELAMLRSRAEELGIEKISDLSRHPELVLGFSNEFMNRADGWPNLKKVYDLGRLKATGLDHDLAYRQLTLGTIDVIDAYSTDAKIEVHDLKLLEDDRDYFPRYDAVLLYREEMARQHPDVVASIQRLIGTLDEQAMMRANAGVEVSQLTESRVAANWLKRELGVTSEVRELTLAGRLWKGAVEHLDLVRKSLIPAILIAVPLGILAYLIPRLGNLLLGFVGIVQTIPALALLVVLMPVMAWLGLASVGLGSATAVTALLLYSLLPIVQNTHSGLKSISPQHREAALALGIPTGYRLLHVELPLATPGIIAGIKTAAVMNIGFATLGALIGAGGYGQPIITGIRLNDTAMILEGAIPAAVLAVLVQFLFDRVERWLA